MTNGLETAPKADKDRMREEKGSIASKHKDGEVVATSQLDWIKVETQGMRDTVTVTKGTYSGKQVFAIVCRPNGACRIAVADQTFLTASDKDVEHIVMEYWRWKRTQVPNLKFPHGHTKSGKPHPWSGIPAVARLRRQEEKDEE